MTPSHRFDDGIIILFNDGSASITFSDRKTLASTTRRFTPAELLVLKRWLTSKDTKWTADPGAFLPTHGVRYYHEDGMLHVSHASGSFKLDPNDEEAFAKFVRKVKSTSRVPKAIEELEPQLPLPVPSDADMRNRQIFLNPALARGYQGQVKGRTAKKTLSREETQRRLDEMAAKLFGS